MDVALASCRNLPEPDFDAAPLTNGLNAAGISSEVLAWDDPTVDWSAARMTVLRSTWNYPRNRRAFVDWATSTSRVSELWNSLPAVRWNSHKSYLLDLQRQGIPITPTELVPRSEVACSLAEILRRREWEQVVIKPAVSAASFRTLRVGPGSIEKGESHFRELLAQRDVLIQEYLPSVEDYGERALVWIDGELTHAVRKSPRFDGEDESVSRAVGISTEEAALAREVVDQVKDPLLYARIDMAPGPDGRPVLMELELIEPSLFFPQNSLALDRFVAAVKHRLTYVP